MSELVQTRQDGAVLTLRLNRPEKLNALNDAMLEALMGGLARAARDDGVRALVLTGEGRAFSTGGDIAAMQAMDEGAFQETIHLYMRLAAAFRALPKIVVAAINGYALAGGFELALMCDLRVAARSAIFGLPDAALGLSPTSGMTWSLPRVVGLGRAMHLTLLGDRFDASEAERIGLVTAVVDDDALLETAQDWARRIAGCPPQAVGGTKRGFYDNADRDFASATAFEEAAEGACFRSGETQERFMEFLRRRDK
jgi:enoyl-CoA hydratase/carnithine racemase